MKIYNLTAHVVRCRGKTWQPCIGEPARAPFERKLIDTLFGFIPVYRDVYGPPQGLPPWQKDIYYIVSARCALAAKAHGRDTSDLLIPYGVSREYRGGRPTSCAGFTIL